MSDYTKCRGNGCAQKESCFRYTSPASDHQSYFVTEPMEASGECEYRIYVDWEKYATVVAEE